MLNIIDVKQLIEILMSHNDQEMKYWLPKDILSVLQNEEVSAYLWAYLNPAEMLPEESNFKKFKTMSGADNFASLRLSNALGEDYNFDLFSFDKLNMHVDSLVIGCSQIYTKFK